MDDSPQQEDVKDKFERFFKPIDTTAQRITLWGKAASYISTSIFALVALWWYIIYPFMSAFFPVALLVAGIVGLFLVRRDNSFVEKCVSPVNCVHVTIFCLYVLLLTTIMQVFDYTNEPIQGTADVLADKNPNPLSGTGNYTLIVNSYFCAAMTWGALCVLLIEKRFKSQLELIAESNKSTVKALQEIVGFEKDMLKSHKITTGYAMGTPVDSSECEEQIPDKSDPEDESDD